MHGIRMLRLGALGVLLGASTTSALGGQVAVRLNRGPTSVDSYYSQLHLAGSAGPLRADGLGVRVMWNRDLSDRGARTELGVYGTYTPERPFGDRLRFSTIGVGLTGDARLLAEPVGRVDPFVSLGAGILRTNVSQLAWPAPSPLVDGSRSAFTLTPGVGTRLVLSRRLAVGGELRQMIAFDRAARQNRVAAAGLRLSL
jgi:hypothetical protein